MRTLGRTALGALLAVAMVTTANAATEAEKTAAIQAGLANLASLQTAGGYWSFGGYEQAATGAAVFAFLSQKDKWNSHAAAYQAAVDAGIAWLLGQATTTTVGVRSDGFNPCGAGTCTGIYWYGAGETTYTTGLVGPAIALYGAATPNAVATVSGPLAGLTWRQIAQGVTNMFAAGQSTAASGNRRGGWRYFPGTGDSDSSTTQWAVIAMIYDQTVGATTPQFVKDELKFWLAAAQDASGVVCYQPGSQPCDHSDTGGFIVAQRFVGTAVSDPSLQSALGWLNANWPQMASGTWYGNFGHPYAMWSVYKGLETSIGLTSTAGITNLATTCGAPGSLPGNPPGSTPCNWWEDYNEWLVHNQNADGSWTGYAYWVSPLSTAFDVAILGATKIPAVVDNTPPSCVLTAVLAGPPVQLKVAVQDTGSGLASVVMKTGVNVSLAVPTFAPGVTSAVLVTASKVNQGAASQITLHVTDVAGNGIDCDPSVAGEAAAPDASSGCTAGSAGLLALACLGALLLRRRS